MTRVQRRVVTFDMQCPRCESDIPAPSGSLNWDVNEQLPKEIKCHNCGEMLQPSKGFK